METIEFEYEALTGIGEETGVCRRDPSDIIKVGDTHYVWYTKVLAQTSGQPTPHYPGGYFGTVWYASSTDGGRTWIERGECVPKGEGGGTLIRTPPLRPTSWSGRESTTFTTLRWPGGSRIEATQV